MKAHEDNGAKDPQRAQEHRAAIVARNQVRQRLFRTRTLSTQQVTSSGRTFPYFWLATTTRPVSTPMNAVMIAVSVDTMPEQRRRLEQDNAD